jgi:hypothetical protein
MPLGVVCGSDLSPEEFCRGKKTSMGGTPVPSMPKLSLPSHTFPATFFSKSHEGRGPQEKPFSRGVGRCEPGLASLPERFLHPILDVYDAHGAGQKQ